MQGSLQSLDIIHPGSTNPSYPSGVGISLSSLNDLKQEAAKGDTQFHTFAISQQALVILHRLSLASTGFAGYQALYSLFALAMYPYSYNTLSFFINLFTFALSFGITLWSSRMQAAEQQPFLTTAPTSDNRRFQNLLNGFFEGPFYIALVLRIVASVPILINMFLQHNYTAQHVNAEAATYQHTGSSLIAGFLRLTAAPLPLFELTMLATFVHAARVMFRHLREPGMVMNHLVFIGSLGLMTSGLGLLFSTHLSNEHAYNPQSVPVWISRGLMTMGMLSALAAVGVWFINHKKDSKQLSLGGGILGGLVFGLLILSLAGYKSSQNVYNAYSDLEALDSWTYRMSGTSEEELLENGCPRKYLPSHLCANTLMEKVWGEERNSEDELLKCLNTECAGLLGKVHSDPILGASNMAMLGAMSGFVVLLGFLYYWHSSWTDMGHAHKMDFGYLAAMGTIALIFMLAYAMSHHKTITGDFAQISGSSSFDMPLSDSAHNSVYNRGADQEFVVPGGKRFKTVTINELPLTKTL